MDNLNPIASHNIQWSIISELGHKKFQKRDSGSEWKKGIYDIDRLGIRKLGPNTARQLTLWNCATAQNRYSPSTVLEG